MSILPLGSFGNLFGPDMMIIAVLNVLVVLGIVWLVRFLMRGGTSGHPARSPDERLQKLDALRRAGLVTDAEYGEQRRRILAEI